MTNAEEDIGEGSESLDPDDVGELRDLVSDDAASRDSGKIVQDFVQKRATYVSACDALQRLVEQLVKAAGITCSVTARTKDVESLREKLRRKSHYLTLQDVPDLVGIRVVVRYLHDVKTVCTLLSEELNVRETTRHTYTSPEAFGYQSEHMVATLKPDRAGLREWLPFAEMSFEIQVRTILQDAWAIISHSLDYKVEGELPHSLRRQLFRVAALLESGDDIFERYSQEVARIGSQPTWRQLECSSETIRANWKRFDWSSTKTAVEEAGLTYRESTYLSEGSSQAFSRACQFYGISTLAELQAYISTVDYGSGIREMFRIDVFRHDKPVILSQVLMAAFLMQPGVTSQVRSYILGVSAHTD